MYATVSHNYIIINNLGLMGLTWSASAAWTAEPELQESIAALRMDMTLKRDAAGTWFALVGAWSWLAPGVLYLPFMLFANVG
jgi:hypothetical protein